VYPSGIAAFFQAKEARGAAGALRIVHPANGTVFRLLEGVEKQAVAIKLEGVSENETVWWFVDSIPVGKGIGASWVYSLVSGSHRLTAATISTSASVEIHVRP
jgi:membrane carboxypeptidase/penicillin-binding protein PbpC